MNVVKTSLIFILIVALALGIFSGCGNAPKNLKLEPFDLEWGITEEEAAELLKCKYYTNEKSPGKIYVPNDINNDTLQAFGNTPSFIIYEFNLKKDGSDARRLGKITYKFLKDSHEQLLTNLEKQCGPRYYDFSQWGAVDSDVYLFEDGTVSIQYSSSPLSDPKTLSADNRDAYIALSQSLFSSTERLAALEIESFLMLWRYSTAETDFVLVDNSK